MYIKKINYLCSHAQSNELMKLLKSDICKSENVLSFFSDYYRESDQNL